MIFKNSKIYDILKYLSLIVLDAVGFAYSELANVWNLPYGTEIMKTCTILSIFIGALIGVSSYKYKNLPIDPDTSLDDDLLVERDDE
jgi:hypothetical protein